MSSAGIEQELIALSSDPSVWEPEAYGRRQRGIAAVSLHSETAPVAGKGVSFDDFAARCLQINRKIEVDLNNRIARKDLKGSEFAAELLGYSEGTAADSPPRYAGADGLDLLLSEMFRLNAFDPGKDPEHREMVQFESTPARAMLHFAESFSWRSDDVFVDIGCGPGLMVFLVALSCQIPCIGIDIDDTYIVHGQNLAKQLGIEHVSFISSDARFTDYAEGTVFFLFTPFVGGVMRDVFARLEKRSRVGEIALCTYGPITLDVDKEQWLERQTPGSPDAYTIGIYSSAKKER